MVQTVSCHQPSVGALQRPAGRGRRSLRPVQSFFRRTTSPTRISTPNGHVSRLGRFEASELRGFLPGREGSTSKRREAPQQGPVKGAELEWANSLNDKYRLGKVLGTGDHVVTDGLAPSFTRCWVLVESQLLWQCMIVVHKRNARARN